MVQGGTGQGGTRLSHVWHVPKRDTLELTRTRVGHACPPLTPWNSLEQAFLDHNTPTPTPTHTHRSPLTSPTPHRRSPPYHHRRHPTVAVVVASLPSPSPSHPNRRRRRRFLLFTVAIAVIPSSLPLPSTSPLSTVFGAVDSRSLAARRRPSISGSILLKSIFVHQFRPSISGFINFDHQFLDRFC